MPNLTGSVTGNITSSMSFTSSSSSSTRNGETTTSGSRSSHQLHMDPSGATVRSTSQNLGEAPREEVRRYDAGGRAVEGGQSGGGGRIEGGSGEGEGEGFTVEDVTEEEAQKERDRVYEERIDEEYAKREGGA